MHSLLAQNFNVPITSGGCQAAGKAGVITESNPLSGPDSKQQDFSVVFRPEADAKPASAVAKDGAGAYATADSVAASSAWLSGVQGAKREHQLHRVKQNIIRRRIDSEESSSSPFSCSVVWKVL